MYIPAHRIHCIVEKQATMTEMIINPNRPSKAAGDVRDSSPLVDDRIESYLLLQ